MALDLHWTRMASRETFKHYMDYTPLRASSFNLTDVATGKFGSFGFNSGMEMVDEMDLCESSIQNFSHYGCGLCGGLSFSGFCRALPQKYDIRLYLQSKSYGYRRV